MITIMLLQRGLARVLRAVKADCFTAQLEGPHFVCFLFHEPTIFK